MPFKHIADVVGASGRSADPCATALNPAERGDKHDPDQAQFEPRFARTGAAALVLAALFAGPAAADGTVNIYTYRQPDLIKPVLDAFTAKTGIATQVLFLDKGLEERVTAEGENSPADVIMTVDISRLAAAKERASRSRWSTRRSTSNIPAEYRDPDGAMVRRHQARPRRLRLEGSRQGGLPSTYADLADPKWKGRICIRSGQHDYNLALFSAMIAHWGEAKTEQWMTASRTTWRASRTAATVRRPSPSTPANATSRSATPTMSA